MTTLIYVLLDPRTREVRYIGKSDNPHLRLERHIRESATETNHKARWIRKLLSFGFHPVLQIIDEVLQSEWQAAEAAYVLFCKEHGCKLVNGTPGGDGSGSGKDNQNFGKKMTAESCAKLSAALKGRKLSPQHLAKLSARRPSQETRLKVSITLQGRPRKPFSAEWRANISEAQKRRKPISDETRAKLSAALKGRKKSPEHSAKVGAAHKGKVLSDELRLRMSIARKGIKLTPEQLAKRVGQKWSLKRRASHCRRLERQWVEQCIASMWN